MAEHLYAKDWSESIGHVPSQKEWKQQWQKREQGKVAYIPEYESYLAKAEQVMAGATQPQAAAGAQATADFGQWSTVSGFLTQNYPRVVSELRDYWINKKPLSNQTVELLSMMHVKAVRGIDFRTWLDQLKTQYLGAQKATPSQQPWQVNPQVSTQANAPKVAPITSLWQVNR